MKLRIFSFTFNPFQENTYLLADENHHALIIDPGCSTLDEFHALQKVIKQHELKLERLLLTHCHIDHVMGCRYIFDNYGLTPEHHEIEKNFLEQVPLQAQYFGIECAAPPKAKNYLVPGTTITVGSIHLKVLFTPGHSPGSVCFFHEPSKNIFSGDVLFWGSIGRTDLPGGDYATLMKSIHQVLLPLGDDVTVWSGHGPKTTLGHEKKQNPFLQ